MQPLGRLALLMEERGRHLPKPTFSPDAQLIRSGLRGAAISSPRDVSDAADAVQEA